MLESITPGDPRDTIHFRFRNDRGIAWSLRALLVVAIVMSAVNLIDATRLWNSVYAFALEVRETIVVQNALGPYESEGVPAAEVRDGVRLGSGAVLFGTLMLLAAATLLPIRYAFLLAAVGRGHPRTWGAVRLWGALMIVYVVLRLVFHFSLADQYETITVSFPPHVFVNAVVGAAMIVHTQQRPVQRYFSVHDVRRRFEPAAVAAGPPGGPPTRQGAPQPTPDRPEGWLEAGDPAWEEVPERGPQRGAARAAAGRRPGRPAAATSGGGRRRLSTACLRPPAGPRSRPPRHP